MRASERSDNSACAALRLASASGAFDVGGGDAGSAFSRTASRVERVSASGFGRCAATAGASWRNFAPSAAMPLVSTGLDFASALDDSRRIVTAPGSRADATGALGVGGSKRPGSASSSGRPHHITPTSVATITPAKPDATAGRASHDHAPAKPLKKRPSPELGASGRCPRDTSRGNGTCGFTLASASAVAERARRRIASSSASGGASDASGAWRSAECR